MEPEALVLGEIGQRAHAAVAENIRADLGQHGSVFQGVSVAGRGLGAVGQHPPTSVRAAGEVGSEHRQARGTSSRPPCLPEIPRIAQYERGWQPSIMEKPLRAVEVVQNEVEQDGPLAQPGGNRVEFAALDKEGQGVQLPWAAGAAGV